MTPFNKIKMLSLSSASTGLVVGVINTLNIRKSDEIRMLEKKNIAKGIILKSCVYGLFFPFSWFFISRDIYNGRDLDRHFIPFSRFGYSKKD